MQILLRIAFSLAVLVVSIAIHEFSHAITADRLGDSTPRLQGRITLNPLAHLDRVGTAMIVLSSLAGFGIGWGKPVQVQPRNFRMTPMAGMGVVAIAGPVSNLVLAALGSLAYRFAGGVPLLTSFIGLWIIINVALALFNLLPVFPLDGYNVFVAILYSVRQNWSLQLAQFWQRQVQYGPLVLMLLLVIDWQFPAISPIGWLFGPPMNLLLRIFVPG